MTCYEIISVTIASIALFISILHAIVSIVKWYKSKKYLAITATVSPSDAHTVGYTEIFFTLCNKLKPFSIIGIAIEYNKKTYDQKGLLLGASLPLYFDEGESKEVRARFENAAIADNVKILIKTNTKTFKIKQQLKLLQQQDQQKEK